VREALLLLLLLLLLLRLLLLLLLLFLLEALRELEWERERRAGAAEEARVHDAKKKTK
jgi:hypothetical protein